MPIRILRIAAILFCLLCFYLTSDLPRVYSQTEFVPVELARTAALHYAAEIFGNVTFLNVETYYDLDDKPIVYVFTLYRGIGLLPSMDEIENKVRSNRIRRVEIEKKIIGLANESVTERKAEIRKYWKEMRQEDDFVTVIASATYDNVPVIQMYAGLPPHMVVIEDTKEIASKGLNTRNIFMKKLRYLPPLRFEFEFEDDLGRNVLVSPLDFEIRDISKLRQVKTIPTGVPKDRQQIIERKWDFIKTLHRDNR